MDAAHVLRLLVAGGFVDPAKVEQARAILANCAPAKIPFIDRHIAAGQPPKPAGAVPLPEPAILSQIGREGWTKSQVEAYGDAREAAARSVAVPDGLVLVPREATPEMLEKAGAMDGWDGNPSYADKSHSEWWDSMIAAAPIPQQPAAEGAKSAPLEIVGWVHEDQLPEGYPYDVMFPHSKVDGVRMFPVFAPTPAADAGGVTVTREMAVRAEAEYFKRVGLSSQPLVVRQDAMLHALAAALTPEVNK